MNRQYLGIAENPCLHELRSSCLKSGRCWRTRTRCRSGYRVKACMPRPSVPLLNSVPRSAIPFLQGQQTKREDGKKKKMEGEGGKMESEAEKAR